MKETFLMVFLGVLGGFAVKIGHVIALADACGRMLASVSEA